MKKPFSKLIAVVLLALGTAFVHAASAPPARTMHLGIDADNWSGQIKDPRFERALRQLNIDFISWHIQPAEEADPKYLDAIVQFCRKNHWAYLFNTEVANYARNLPAFQHPDGTYRYDVADHTLALLKDDPLFLGVVYDEGDLMQGMLGVKAGGNQEVKPYLVDTRNMDAADAFLAVSRKVGDLNNRYKAYGKRMIFEMVFPDYPFAYARGGALLAPKLMKENFNDLMYGVYRGAALEYHQRELWTCIDLWFLDKFPFNGKGGNGFHTPAQLLESLQYAYSSGFDYAYVEQMKGLMDQSYNLTEYGKQLLTFQEWRKTHKFGDWRTAPIQYYLKRFPDGYWGQQYSTFIPDHPYGSWKPNPYREQDRAWLTALNKLSHGQIAPDANNWNALTSNFYKQKSYQEFAGLPSFVVFDHFGVLPKSSKAVSIDFTQKGVRLDAIH